MTQTLEQLSAAFDDFAKASGTFGTRGYDAVKTMIDQLRTGQLVAVSDDAIERVVDRTIIRLRALPDYAGRPAWEDVIREELIAAMKDTHP